MRFRAARAEGPLVSSSQDKPGLPEAPVPSEPGADFPDELRGPRILLRLLELEDAAAVWAAVEESRAHLEPWLPWVRTLRSIEDERADIAKLRERAVLRTDWTVGIFDRFSGRYLGGSGLHRIRWESRTFEIGYFIRVSEEGKGYITETVRLLTRLAFDRLRANRVEIYIDPRNVRSIRVPERLGFVLDGTLRRLRAGVEGRLEDRHLFALIRDDYHRLPWREDHWNG